VKTEAQVGEWIGDALAGAVGGLSCRCWRA
jgi:hypothetical protein